jgi:hypothetical protein
MPSPPPAAPELRADFCKRVLDRYEDEVVKMQVNRLGRNILLWLIGVAEKEGLLFVRFQRSI